MVMDETIWKGATGDSVFNTLTEHVYGLPQPEPLFNVVHIGSSAFTKIFQTHRNLLIVHIGAEHQRKVELRTNVWAEPQVVIEVAAPTQAEFLELYSKNRSKIIDHVLETEQKRTIKSYESQLDKEVAGSVRARFGVGLSIPRGYRIVREEEDFVWARYEDKDITQSVLIYSEPYKRQNTFTSEGMTEVMDKFAKQYVPGPDAGTYMTTYLEYPPRLEETSISGKYASKLVGVWNVEGALMGGPFVSYAMLNGAENKVIYLHGFVYAPGKKKRNYLRQVDAILNSATVD